MIIKVISDTHNDHTQLDQTSLEADVLIHCGDFGTKGKYTEAENFLLWFVKQPAKYKILVPGNHDKRIKTHPDLHKLAYDLGINFLMSGSIDINGYLFHCESFVPTFRNGQCQETVEFRKEQWQDIPKETTVLITHAPPRTILDTNVRGEHLGCEELLYKINEIQPAYHVFGHIHEHAHKRIELNGTTFINCCNKNELYVTTETKPVIFELPDLEAK